MLPLQYKLQLSCVLNVKSQAVKSAQSSYKCMIIFFERAKLAQSQLLEQRKMTELADLTAATNRTRLNLHVLGLAWVWSLQLYIQQNKLQPVVCERMSYNYQSQRISLELASWSQKAGSSLQNLWSILYDIGASQVVTQLRQFKNVQISLCTTSFLLTTPLTYYIY